MSERQRAKERRAIELVASGEVVVGADGVVMRGGNRIGSPGDDGYWRVLGVYLHRLVYLVHHGLIPAGIEVNHRDLNKSNNAADNLELMTKLENMHHANDALGNMFKNGHKIHPPPRPCREVNGETCHKCRDCDKWKPVSVFRKLSSGYLASYCNECERVRGASYKRATRAKANVS